MEQLMSQGKYGELCKLQLAFLLPLNAKSKPSDIHFSASLLGLISIILMKRFVSKEKKCKQNFFISI